MQLAALGRLCDSVVISTEAWRDPVKRLIPHLPIDHVAVGSIVSADAIAAELGDWARGRAMDQQLSGEKARRELGWTPVHLDPEGEIAALATDE